jgi:type II secretory pathway pseudopilin PulG
MQQLLARPAMNYRYGYRPVRSLRGLGDAQGQATAQQATGVAVSTAGAALPLLVNAGWIAASAVPFIGAGLAVAAALAQYLIKNSGCGQTCIQTSAWANQAAQALQQVLDGYFNGARTISSQALALQAFDQTWAKLVQLCSDPQWGDAGKRCISDRQRGACTWKQAYAPAYPGEPQVGECWNWFNGYRDPIANDPDVKPDPVTIDATSQDLGTVANSLATSMSGLSPLLLLGGGILALAFLGGDN